jgi:hypothetical protein
LSQITLIFTDFAERNVRYFSHLLGDEIFFPKLVKISSISEMSG